MTKIGVASLVLALVLAAYGAIVSAYGAAERKRRFTASGENAVYAAWALLSLASLALLYAFLSRDFQVEYVYNYSSRTLPFFYTLSAFWAGQKGSLLLWAWLLATFSSLMLLQNREIQLLQTEYIPRNPTVAVFFSALFPGAGQVYNGEAPKGLVIAVLMLVCVYILGWTERGFPGIQRAAPIPMSVVLFTAVGAAVYIYAVVDAHLSARRGRRARSGWEV